jgi:hypothetical protein
MWISFRRALRHHCVLARVDPYRIGSKQYGFEVLNLLQDMWYNLRQSSKIRIIVVGLVMAAQQNDLVHNTEAMLKSRIAVACTDGHQSSTRLIGKEGLGQRRREAEWRCVRNSNELQ